MADRFEDCSSVLIESLKDNAKSKNAKLSTTNWLRVWKTWAKEKGHDENIRAGKIEQSPRAVLRDGTQTRRY